MKMGETAKKSGVGLWLHPAIMVVLMLSGWISPTFGTITEFGSRIGKRMNSHIAFDHTLLRILLGIYYSYWKYYFK